MPTVTKTIGPGKDYATLTAWVAARSGSIVIGTGETATCFSGADLGACSITWNTGPVAITTISADSTSRHNGTDAGTAGVAYSTGLIELVSLSNCLIDHMRLYKLRAGTLVDGADPTYTILDNMFVVNAAVTDSAISIFASGEDGGIPFVSCVITNNIIYWKPTSGLAIWNGIEIVTVGNGHGDSIDVFAQVDNNTILVSNTSTITAGLNINLDVDSANSTCVIRNNLISVGSVTPPYCYFYVDNNGSNGVNNQYNLSTDDTASSFALPFGAGSHCLNEANPGVVSVSTNATLKSTSDARDTGLNIGGIATPDAIGVARPVGAAWDIGALEFVQTAVARAWRTMRFWSH